MPIQLYDTLDRALKPLQASDGNTLRFYCCGPTVYGPAHIGNFRTFILQDVLRRSLEVAEVQVKHVRNITDVDDKTIRESQKLKLDLKTFTEKWTQKFHADCKKLNMLTPHVEPKATEHIKEQIELIQKLIDKQHAYMSNDGSVYYKVDSFANYGKLSNLDRDHLRTQNVNSAGEMNDADEYERESVSDFALWKSRKPEDGNNFWKSLWGEGRPGWHIECSAMSQRYLGESFDLHGGGIDLCFPHHENEIAQSEAACGCKPFVQHWFHSAHLMVEGAKMSKSLSNLYTLDDLETKGYSPMVVRWALLNGHYRQSLNFTENGLNAAQSALHKLEKHIDSLLNEHHISQNQFSNWQQPNTMLTTGIFEKAWSHLKNDLNIPAAIGDLFSGLKTLDQEGMDKDAVCWQLQALASLLYALGIQLFNASDTPAKTDVPDEVKSLAEERWNAKKNKDFATADALRDKIAQSGWSVKDKADGYDIVCVTS